MPQPADPEAVLAQHLVGMIREYWIDHGRPGILAWAEAQFLSDKIQGRTVMVIRSNIGPDGYPPKRSVSAVKVSGMAW